MPKLNPSKVKVYRPDSANNRLSFRERLLERFAPHEYVRVINIDNAPVKWQYLPSHAEEVTYTADPMKITTRGEVEVYLLNPGESEVLLGECAILFFDVLFKQMQSKRVIEHNPEVGPGIARNFNFSDAIAQEEFIDKAYLGKENPNFSSYETIEPPKAEVKKNERKPRTPKERELKQHLAEQTA